MSDTFDPEISYGTLDEQPEKPTLYSVEVFCGKPDPAQSAPSAEPIKFSGSDAKKWWWENVKKTPFKMTPERIWAHCEAYAALRTAQLAAFKEYVHKRLDAEDVPANPEPEANQSNGCRIEGRLNFIFGRAETAESALREIVGNVDLKQLLGWLDFELSGSPGDGMLSDCKEIISRVAAQTPEEK